MDPVVKHPDIYKVDNTSCPLDKSQFSGQVLENIHSVMSVLPSLLVDSIYYHMTRMALCTISLENHKKKVPM